MQEHRTLLCAQHPGLLLLCGSLSLQLVLAVKLGVPAASAVSTVQTLSDVEAKCVEYAKHKGGSDTASPLPAVEVKRSAAQCSTIGCCIVLYCTALDMGVHSQGPVESAHPAQKQVANPSAPG